MSKYIPNDWFVIINNIEKNEKDGIHAQVKKISSVEIDK